VNENPKLFRRLAKPGAGADSRIGDAGESSATKIGRRDRAATADRSGR
jgi:hypothetical protein